MSALYKNFVILRTNYDRRSADSYFFYLLSNSFDIFICQKQSETFKNNQLTRHSFFLTRH